jgi:hypothetical protein
MDIHEYFGVLSDGATLSNSTLLLAIGASLSVGLAVGFVVAALRASIRRRIRGRQDVSGVGSSHAAVPVPAAAPPPPLLPSPPVAPPPVSLPVRLPLVTAAAEIPAPPVIAPPAVSRFAPKPVPVPEFPVTDRKVPQTPIIDSVPVLDAPDENSDSVIDVPRGDTGERVTLLTPQPGDPTPEELAAIVANQFKDDVVYEIPPETFGSFHLVDADAFAAVDNEPTSLPTPQAAPTAGPLLTEENAAFVIDLLADRPVYSPPRLDDRAAESPAYDPPVYEVPLIDPPVYEVPLIDPPVYEVPLVDASAPVLVEIPVSEPTAPRPFVAPEAWPAPRLVVTPEAEEDTAEAPVLARVTPLPTRERLARESYLLKSRELERAAQERLRYEQERLEARIREQLEADRRQLAGKLDALLEDTVMLPRKANEA